MTVRIIGTVYNYGVAETVVIASVPDSADRLVDEIMREAVRAGRCWNVRIEGDE